MPVVRRKLVSVALLASGLAGCGGYPSDFMREPSLSPVGSGLVAANQRAAQDATASALDTHARRGPPPVVNLYTDPRVSQVGDIVTVVISINDKATFDNSTDRSKTANSNLNLNWGFSTGSSQSQPDTVTAGLTSTSSTQGQGNIGRQEQIQVSVAAVVTEVLPNGNLVIAGSQEVRVNYEMRDLTIAGIVHPEDISRSNTIAYDRIAEARISYGGRGRLTEVQQPNWGQEIYDIVKPF
jgi:flagellar L-ring protein precursor FlgH